MANNIHIIFGSDDGLVSESALKLYNQLKGEDGDEFANDVIEGVADNAEKAYEIATQTVQALQTLPFFGGGKIVWLKNATFLGNDRTSQSQRAVEGADFLKQTLEQGLPDDVHFILSANAFDKRRGFFTWLKKNATISTHDKIDTSKANWQEALVPVVRRMAQERGLEFDQEALDLFVSLSEEGTRQIKAELEKLDLYLGEQRRGVTLVDVRTMVPLTREGVVFEIGRALQTGQGAHALHLIDDQLEKGNSAIAIMRASIITTVRNLYFAKLLQEKFPKKQLSPQNINSVVNALPEQDLLWLPQTKAGKPSVWGIGFSLGSARYYTLSGLRRAMEFCLEADHSLVTSGLNNRTVLHRLVVQLVALRKKKAS